MLPRLVSKTAAGLMAIVAAGCGGDNSAEPMMTEAKHSHYHVHAVDASHEHSHPDGAVGGHVHVHRHSKE